MQYISILPSFRKVGWAFMATTIFWFASIFKVVILFHRNLAVVFKALIASESTLKQVIEMFHSKTLANLKIILYFLIFIQLKCQMKLDTFLSSKAKTMRHDISPALFSLFSLLFSIDCPLGMLWRSEFCECLSLVKNLAVLRLTNDEKLSGGNNYESVWFPLCSMTSFNPCFSIRFSHRAGYWICRTSRLQ